MEKWQYSLDEMLANPPEGEESKFVCECCKEPFEPGDRVYSIEGENLCIECATSWFDEQFHFAQETECYGDK